MTTLAQYNLTASDGTTSTAGLGDEVNVGGAIYKYVLTSATVTAFQACIVSDTGTIQPATTALCTNFVGDIVIPQFDMASGEYGWAPVGPFNTREDGSTTFKVSALANCVLDVILYTTATAGSIDDTATVQIKGLKLLATNGGSTANVACRAVTRLTVNA